MVAAPGLFVTFEGLEGTGKTTQLERLAARLRASGRSVVLTREPGGTPLGRELRTLLLRPAGEPMSPLVELLLLLADRAQHLSQVVEPALAAGQVVLSDRYVDATFAYQGHGRSLGDELVRDLHRHPPLDRLPARTILLELAPEEALARARRRNDLLATAAAEGRFEAEELDFHRRVAEGYRAVARRAQDRVRVIDASGAPEEVETRVVQGLADLWPGLLARC